MADAREPRYDVLWPLSRRAVRETKAAARLPDLNGKVVAELWDVIFRGETIYPLVREHIRKRFPGVKFVGYSEFGNFHGAREREVVASIPEKLRAHKADAVIVGIGA
jgi:UDP-N-acetyl-D-mannosaminuronic acid transferase (WecB/TagA/CpsF family)